LHTGVDDKRGYCYSFLAVIYALFGHGGNMAISVSKRT